MSGVDGHDHTRPSDTESSGAPPRCTRDEALGIATALIRDGQALLPTGHRMRTVIFASIVDTAEQPKALVISPGHIVRFLRSYLDEHWEVLRHSDTNDPALGSLMTFAKAERGVTR